MNPRTLLIVILLILFSWSLKSVASEKSLLWRISGNGLETPSYLFGTHHLMPISFLNTIQGLNEAFESTKQMVGELDMYDMTALQIQMTHRALMPPNLSYESLLNAEELALLNNTLLSLTGAGLDQWSTKKPAMLSNMITVLLYHHYFPETNSGISMDAYFQQKARIRLRPVIGLETIDHQLYVMFDVSSIERQAFLLMCKLIHPDLMRETLHQLHSMYEVFDLHGLYQLWAEDHPDNPCPNTDCERNALNRDRNIRWLAQLPSIMQEKPSFIAVGALHLPGENGLLQGLRRQGFVVKPVQ